MGNVFGWHIGATIEAREYTQQHCIYDIREGMLNESPNYVTFKSAPLRCLSRVAGTWAKPQK